MTKPTKADREAAARIVHGDNHLTCFEGEDCSDCIRVMTIFAEAMQPERKREGCVMCEALAAAEQLDKEEA